MLITAILLNLLIIAIAVYLYNSWKANQQTTAMKRHLARAKVYLEQKEYTNALLECTDGLEGKIESSKQKQVYYEILCVIAETQCAQKKYSDAMDTYKRLIMASNPPSDVARECITQILIFEQWAYEDKAVACAALALLDYYENQYPDKKDFTKERIRLRSVIDGDEVALAEYEKLIASNPQDASIYSERAEVFLKQKDYSSAIADYTKAIELRPQVVWIYEKRAMIFLKQGDYASAIADYTKMIELEPAASAHFYRSRANAFFLQNDYASALTDYAKAIEMEPQDSWVYWDRARVYLAQKDYTNAIADCTKAIALNPKESAAFYCSRANAYFEQKDYTTALADYAKAIELDSEYDTPYIKRAKIYLEQKNYASAIADCTRAIEIDPAWGWAYSVLADINATQGQFPEAISNYTTAIEKFSTAKQMLEAMRIKFLSEAYKKRGDVHQKLGNTAQAEADFAKANELERK